MSITKTNLLNLRNNSPKKSIFENPTQEPKPQYNPSFRGAGKLADIPLGEIELSKKFGDRFDLRRRLGDWNNHVGFLACMLAVIGFGVGGPSLIYDNLYKKKHGIKNTKDPNKEEEYGHFESATNIGKIGLKMNQGALTVSGIAGAMTGFSCGMPIMAAGEFIGNVVAAPVINTPIGYGLLNIGLAAIFGGRAFDTDPSHKAKMSMFLSKKTNGEKAKYVMNNMWECVKSAGNSTSELLKNIAHLLSFDKATRQGAKDFFRYKMIRVKSSTMTIKQNIGADGTIKKVEAGLKDHPQLLLAASSLLALAGVFVITTEVLKKIGIIKSDKPTKAGFTAGKVGQVLDNYGIVAYGLKRCNMGNTTAGVATVVSGATMIAGAPNADNDFGKGLTWAGLASFFLFLAAERFQDSRNATKAFKAVKKYLSLDKVGKANLEDKGILNEATAFVRQFEIDLSKIIPKKHLNNFRNTLDCQNEDSWKTLIKAIKGEEHPKVKAAEKAQEEIKAVAKAALEGSLDEKIRRLPELIKFVKVQLGALEKEGQPAHKFNPNYGIEQLKAAINKQFPGLGYADAIEIKGLENHGDAIREAIYANILKSGKNYAKPLDELTRSADPTVRDIATKCKTDYQKLLEVE